MHRFFILENDSLDLHENTFEIFSPETLRHGKAVRLEANEEIELCKDGNEYVCKIESVSAESICGNILRESDIKRESKVNIEIFQCVTKGQKLDLIVQKNVELGVNSFQLVDSNRVIKKLDDKKEGKLIERLNKIAFEAAKQSKRGKIPIVKPLVKLKKLEETIASYDSFIVLYEDERKVDMKMLLDEKMKNVAIMIGPEGGFDPEEIELLIEYGASICTLGKRILRAETAGFAATTIVQYEIGDI